MITHSRLSEAEQLLETLIEWASTQEDTNPIPSLNCQNEIARIAIRRGDASKAIEISKNVLETIENAELEYLFGKGVALETIGASFFWRGENDRAVDNYNQALAIWKQVDNQDHIGRCLNNLANIDSTIGRFSEALNRYKEALVIWTSIGDHIGKAACLNNIAIVKQNSGDLLGALQGFRESLEEARGSGNNHAQAIALDNIGWVHAALGAPEQALECFEDAETFFTTENAPDLHIDIAYGKASVLADARRFEESEKVLTIGLTAANQLDSKPLQVAGSFFEGYLDLAQHNLKSARIALENTLEEARAIELVEYILRALIHLVEVDLLEYRASSEEIHLETMEERISEAYSQATKYHQILFLIEIAKLEALLAAANLKFEKAIKGMEFVEQFARERHLLHQARNAEQHLQRLRRMKERTQKQLMHRMEKEQVDEMLDAVKDVQKHFRAKGS